MGVQVSHSAPILRHRHVAQVRNKRTTFNKQIQVPARGVLMIGLGPALTDQVQPVSFQRIQTNIFPRVKPGSEVQNRAAQCLKVRVQRLEPAKRAWLGQSDPGPVEENVPCVSNGMQDPIRPIGPTWSARQG